MEISLDSLIMLIVGALATLFVVYRDRRQAAKPMIKLLKQSAERAKTLAELDASKKASESAIKIYERTRDEFFNSLKRSSASKQQPNGTESDEDPPNPGA